MGWGQIATMVASTIGGLIEGHHKYEEKTKAYQKQADRNNIMSYNNSLSQYYKIENVAGAGGIINSSLYHPHMEDFGITGATLMNNNASSTSDGLLTDFNHAGMAFGSITYPKKDSLFDEMLGGAVEGAKLGQNIIHTYSSVKSMYNANKALHGEKAAKKTVSHARTTANGTIPLPVARPVQSVVPMGYTGLDQAAPAAPSYTGLDIAKSTLNSATSGQGVLAGLGSDLLKLF